MLKPDKRCKVCKLIKKDHKLLRRIYECSQFQAGGESLRDIARDYEAHFEYQSLYNHCKKHQGLNERDLENKIVQRKARQIELEKLNKIIKHTEIRDELLEIGVSGIREGEIKLNGGNVVNLLKQKADIEAKEKDQQLEMMKMVQDYTSGAIVDIIEGEIVE